MQVKHEDGKSFPIHPHDLRKVNDLLTGKGIVLEVGSQASNTGLYPWPRRSSDRVCICQPSVSPSLLSSSLCSVITHTDKRFTTIWDPSITISTSFIQQGWVYCPFLLCNFWQLYTFRFDASQFTDHSSLRWVGFHCYFTLHSVFCNDWDSSGR